MTSIGGARESVMEDKDMTFQYFPLSTPGGALQEMNGMTMAANGEDHRGFVYGWTSSTASIEWEITAGNRDLSGWKWLAFRACQMTRHPNTRFELGDLTFDVVLIDEDETLSTINIGAYDGGIEEPYQREFCGGGSPVGWANFFETIRIPLVDFTSEGNAIDLTRVRAIRFEHGALHGSSRGRLGLDDLEFVRE